LEEGLTTPAVIEARDVMGEFIVGYLPGIYFSPSSKYAT